MAYLVMRITFAGMLTAIFPFPCYSLRPVAKNTRVVPYVQLRAYAKSIQLRSPSKLRSLGGTKRFSTPR